MSFNGDGIRTCAWRGARREQQAPPHGASRPPVRPSPCLPRRTLSCCIQCLRFERGLQAHAPSGSRGGAVSPASRCHPSHLSGRVHVATRNATSTRGPLLAATAPGDPVLIPPTHWTPTEPPDKAFLRMDPCR